MGHGLDVLVEKHLLARCYSLECAASKDSEVMAYELIDEGSLRYSAEPLYTEIVFVHSGLLAGAFGICGVSF